MKVLFQSRTNLFSVPGGDTVQMLKTAEFLEKQGVKVDISTEISPRPSGYDLIHLFNLMNPQEVYLQGLNASRHGVPIALSTIYGLYTEYERMATVGLRRFVARTHSPWQIQTLRVLGRCIKNRSISKGEIHILLNGFYRQCRRLTDLVDVFLPNSDSEMRRVQNDFPKTRGTPFIVVPNAVDTSVFKYSDKMVDERYKKYTDCVLSAARIEGRKCQLEIVRAIKHLDADLLLIGQPAPNHKKYFEAVKKEASSRVHFIGQVDHHELVNYYRAAKVHALVSWMETPGLSSLEAGASGCNLVVTDKGDTRDYFGDEVEYCDPKSIESIVRAMQNALCKKRSRNLSDRICREFNWEKTAQMTIKGYEEALRKRYRLS